MNKKFPAAMTINEIDFIGKAFIRAIHAQLLASDQIYAEKLTKLWDELICRQQAAIAQRDAFHRSLASGGTHISGS